MGGNEDAERAKHREWLIQAEHTASRDFDRTITTLAAGALGLSILFVQNIATHSHDRGWLSTAWALFGLSLVFILASFLTSQHALRFEIRRLDSGVQLADGGRPGGCWGTATVVLNWVAAVAFVLGAGALATFAFLNL